MPIRIFIAAALLGAAASAQTTWIVDALGGPGAHFTDLPPAIAAAAPGDTILVLEGIYSPFSTDEGLRVLGSPNTRMSWIAPATIVVHDLPAGATFVMENLQSFGFPGPMFVELRDDAGAVHVERCDATSRLVVTRCAHVTLANLALRDVEVTDSLVTVTSVRASDVNYVWVMAATITAVRSAILLSASDVAGEYRNSCGPFGHANTPSVLLDASRLIVSAGTSITGGGDPCFAHPVPGVLARGSTVEVDPGAVIAGSSGAAPIVSDRSVASRSIPMLTATGGPPGGVLEAARRRWCRR